MDERDETLLRRLEETFRIEAAEHLEAVGAGLVELEKAPAVERRAELVETLFREVHSLKGAARTVNLRQVETLCRALESVFASLKRQEINLSRPLFDLLHQALDLLVEVLQAGAAERAPAEKVRLRELTGELERAARGEPTEAGGARPRPAAGQTGSGAPPGVGALTSGTTRISNQKLDQLLLQAEELMAVKLAGVQRVTALRQLSRDLAGLKKEGFRVRQELRTAERSSTGSGARPGAFGKTRRELELQGETAARLQHQAELLAGALEHDRRVLATMVDALLERVKAVSMLPFAALLAQLPKAARDLSHAHGKEAELAISGAEAEIDRRILAELKDPLLHLLRNSIDHGLERPEARERAGKPRAGRISIEILPLEGKQVSVRFADDGAGIDRERIRSAGLKAGLLSPAEAVAFDPARDPSLVFRSGISGSPLLTDLSGRGLGLAIVKEKVEALGGRVSCQSTAGAGTVFLLTLPLTLAVFRGILVRVGEQQLVIPSLAAEQVVRFRREEVGSVGNRETILLYGEALPLVALRAVLEMGPGPGGQAGSGAMSAVVLGSGPQRIAFGVDEVMGEQEMLIKDLGRQLARVRNVAGSTILASGRLVPVLHVPDLMKSAGKAGAASPPADDAALQEAARPAILVVEDSITARTLLRSILEAAGYAVATAVDGVDAFAALRTGEFALVVSDVDMPRLNGFELTARIRANPRFAELPVILVTALESREDRERGIDVGANAYIVKSSFDQSNLLEAIRRLL